MTLSIATIEGSVSDEHLFSLIQGELSRLLPGEEGDDPGDFLRRLSQLPAGFQAMAAMYQLDVSMALDDFGCHFYNWHHRGYIEKQIWALRELQAQEEADLLAEAYRLAQPYWEQIEAHEDFAAFCAWYNQSRLHEALIPLNKKMWDLCSRPGRERGMLHYWMDYARKYPERLQRGS